MASDATESTSVFTFYHIATAFITYWVCTTIYGFVTAPRPPNSLPWVGYGKSWIADLRNFIAVTESKYWVSQGYEKYSRKGNAFVLPSTLGMPAEIVLPPDQLRWMFDQPDNVLSSQAAHYDLLRGDYSFVDPAIITDSYHAHVIHKHLVKNLNAIIPGLAKDATDSVRNIYGTDTQEWKKLDLLQSFIDMIPLLTNHLLVGETICYDQRFLDAILGFTEDVIRNSAILLVVPDFLHPIIGPLLSLAPKYHYWLSSKFTLPLVKQRISEIEKKDSGDPEYKDWQEPNDFITWCYRTAKQEGRHEEMQPDRIAKRILPLNFASIHTTALTAYDILSQIISAGSDVVYKLREEAYRVLQEEGGWTKQGLNRMYKMDSAIRESQRIAPLSATFSDRKVVAKQGVIIPDGTHVEYGNTISCPWAQMAVEPNFTDNPNVYDAFRYSREREAYEAMSAEEKRNVDVLKMKQRGMVATSTQHLPFGHGRHACPGRFFVAYELKILFAELLLNYHIKPFAQPPEKMWVVRTMVPRPTTIEVRRRESMWTPEAEN
ncbi:CypX Cytochrome P450 [Pyrenophora tritici-repentis]|nr:CypX Cytochrome P450 [Pyrenophora tritici-repentis]